MRSVRACAVLFLSLSSALLVACAADTTAPADDATGDGTAEAVKATSIESAVHAADADLKKASGGHDFLYMQKGKRADWAKDLGKPLSRTERADALAQCAIYGGGEMLSPPPNVDPTDDDRYVKPAQRKVIADALDAKLGAARAYRVDHMGIGDMGFDFDSTCVIAIESGSGQLILLQGKSTDRLA